MRHSFSFRLISAALIVTTAFNSLSASAYAAADVTVPSEKITTQSEETAAQSGETATQPEESAQTTQSQTEATAAATQQQIAGQEQAAGESTGSVQESTETDAQASADSSESSSQEGTDINSLIEDVTQNADGTITATDVLGSKTTLNPETGEVSAEIADITPNLIYKESDAARDMGDAEYVGTEEKTGLALY